MASILLCGLVCITTSTKKEGAVVSFGTHGPPSTKWIPGVGFLQLIWYLYGLFGTFVIRFIFSCVNVSHMAGRFPGESDRKPSYRLP